MRPLDLARRAGRLLVVYLTVADPLTADLAPALAAAGADVLELGLPTPNTRPRGAEIAASFRRSASTTPTEMWRRLIEIRWSLPDTPIVLLCYPETVADLGWAPLLRHAARADVEGLVLTEPTEADMRRCLAASGTPIPLLRPGAPDTHRLEALAPVLTYRPLAGRTGERLDLPTAVRAAEALAAEAVKPFLLGFGVRSAAEIRALARYGAGVVIGSELLRVVSRAPAAARASAAAAAVREWKSALTPGPPPG